MLTNFFCRKIRICISDSIAKALNKASVAEIRISGDLPETLAINLFWYLLPSYLLLQN
jgi:hypothetical protein